MNNTIKEKYEALTKTKYDNLGKYKINADFVRYYVKEECYREIMVSYLPMLPLLEHTVPFEEADYILYMHMYARCNDFSDFVVEQLKSIDKLRKKGAEIIVLGKSANAEKALNGEISNITFWGDHFTEKLGKKFGFDIKEQYFVYDDSAKHLAIWPVDGCLNKCKFCRRSYMDIKFESLSLETIKKNLDRIKMESPEQLKKVSIRAENLTEYGIDIYGKPMLHQLIYLIDSYDEIKEIEFPIGICIGEITPEILKAFCSSKKITQLNMNIETGSDRLLRLIGKKHTTSQVKYVFSEIHKAIPNVRIESTVMIGLPTENMGDVLETAKIIVETKPDFVLCNYFRNSPHLPLAELPQLSASCRKYHFKKFLEYLHECFSKLPNEEIHDFSMDGYAREKRPLSRKQLKEKENIIKLNEERVSSGLLPMYPSVIYSVRKE